MAVIINDVYQKVLAIANKEQRGYITPQEFNLFANQAQMDIFEQYFYDKNQYNRLPKDNTPYADLDHLLEEKISIFKKRQQPVTIISEFGDGTLPNDVYRLDNVLRLSLTGVDDSYANTIEEVTEDELILFERTPLSRPTPRRPIYSRTSATGIKIRPRSATPSASAAPYFIVGGFDIDSGSSNIVLDLTNPNATNYTFIEVGQGVEQANIPSNTFVGSITTGTNIITIGLVNSSGSAVNATGDGDPVQVTFATDDIKCDYIRKPATVKWTYTVSGDYKALYNGSASDLQDFELHASEENNLVIKILQLAGISIKDTLLIQAASTAESSKINQQKQ